MKRVENPLAPEAVADLCIIVVEDTRRDEVHCVTRAVLAVKKRDLWYRNPLGVRVNESGVRNCHM